jgi:ectoine hydroxylase
MPEPRAMNIAVFMDEVMPINGPLMLVPRSHKHGVPPMTRRRRLIPCRRSTRKRSQGSSRRAASSRRKPGAVLMFHGNLVHASAPNITPYPRRIVYLTLSAVSNYIRKPTRPEWIAHRDFTSIDPVPASALLD